MKRFLAALLCALIAGTVLAFAACSDGSSEGGEGNGNGGTPQAPVNPDAEVLVVYYSATGNTEGVANHIATLTGGNTFELVPVDPYTSADLRWTDENSRVVQEYENEELRDVELVSATPENWENYDTVFIGYTIWWGIAAWPVNGFIEANDFTGKTVIPFCTSSSSGLVKAASCLPKWRARAIGLKGKGSARAHPKAPCATGLKA